MAGGVIFMKPRKFLPLLVLIFSIAAAALTNHMRGINAVPVLDTDSKDLIIIMYHSVLKDTSRTGKYVVTPDNVKQDIEYLKNNGYTFVSAQEVIDYSENSTGLPDKAAMLTFDDGNYNFYSYVVPILEQTGANAVVSVVGRYTDEFSESNIKNASYGYMRWSEVYDMFLSNRVEVGNHSYDFHSTDKGRNGSMKNKNESMDEYKQIFVSDTEKAQNRFMTKTGFTPVIYTYPFGAYTEETTQWLKDMGFKLTLGCTEGINRITHDTNSLFFLKRYNRPGGISTEQFFSEILSGQSSSS